MSRFIIAINTGDYWNAGDSLAHAEALCADLVAYGAINEADEPEIIDLDEEE